MFLPILQRKRRKGRISGLKENVKGKKVRSKISTASCLRCKKKKRSNVLKELFRETEQGGYELVVKGTGKTDW